MRRKNKMCIRDRPVSGGRLRKMRGSAGSEAGTYGSKSDGTGPECRKKE